MNQTELLDQFVIEARECLQAIGGRLLDVERDPTNLELLNDLFRSVHTLKGNCGLFEFKPLERVVHAGEDLLDRVRCRTLDYSGALADALLEAMDYSALLIDQIERSGRIDESAEPRSMEHARVLRSLLVGAAMAAVEPSPAMAETAITQAAAAQPDWLDRFGPATMSTASLGEAAMCHRAATLWAEQCALLARGGLAAGAVLGARRALSALTVSLDEVAQAKALADLEAVPQAPAALLAWARQHQPAANAPAVDAIVVHAMPLADDHKVGELPARADDGAAGQPHKVLKVGQEKIDRLMELIGEMVVAKNSLPYLAERAEEVFGQRELAREIKAQYAVINRIAEDLQHAVMQVRMLPVGAVFKRFGRLVRDISRKLGKEVHLVIEGEDTEADKSVIEALAEPLIHVLRNSLDHGIELPEVRRAAGKPAAGTIRILARQESDRVVIEIHDDGAGVDPARVRAKAVERGLIAADRAPLLSDAEAVQLVFLPGFSTAEAITDLSGRGVGMDVVRTAIERINGGVELTSVLGKGTLLRLSLPLSMAVTHVMVIESAGRRLGVPMDLIVETVRVHTDDVHHFKHARTAVLRGRVVPLRALNELLALDAEPLCNEQGELAVLVVRIGNQNVGLLVDHFHGASDIILKPLEGVLAGLVGFAGSALMGDGGVLMILNPKELLA